MHAHATDSVLRQAWLWEVTAPLAAPHIHRQRPPACQAGSIDLCLSNDHATLFLSIYQDPYVLAKLEDTEKSFKELQVRQHDRRCSWRPPQLTQLVQPECSLMPT